MGQPPGCGRFVPVGRAGMNRGGHLGILRNGQSEPKQNKADRGKTLCRFRASGRRTRWHRPARMPGRAGAGNRSPTRGRLAI